MRIAQELIDEVVAHSRDDLPNECCGIIGGRDGGLETVYRAHNSAATWLRYELDPADLYRIVMKEIPAAGEEVTGIYHSHTKSPAEPSQTDMNLSEPWPDVVQLICSLEHADAPVVRGYLLTEATVEEVDLDVG